MTAATAEDCGPFTLVRILDYVWMHVAYCIYYGQSAGNAGRHAMPRPRYGPWSRPVTAGRRRRRQIEMMKFDMGGSAATLGAARATGLLQVGWGGGGGGGTGRLWRLSGLDVRQATP